MTKKKGDPAPVSLGVYKQLVFDCAMELLSGDCDKKAIIDRLIDLSNYSIKDIIFAPSKDAAAEAPVPTPNVKVIIEEGIVQDVLSDGLVAVEVVDINKDYEDYDKLADYRGELYADGSLKSVEYVSMHFGEEEED